MTNIGNPQPVAGTTPVAQQPIGEDVQAGVVAQSVAQAQPQAMPTAPASVQPQPAVQAQVPQQVQQAAVPVVEALAPLQKPTSGVITIEMALIQIDLSTAHQSSKSIDLPLAGQRHPCKHGESYIVTKEDAEMFAITKAPFVIHHKEAILTVTVS